MKRALAIAALAGCFSTPPPPGSGGDGGVHDGGDGSACGPGGHLGSASFRHSVAVGDINGDHKDDAVLIGHTLDGQAILRAYYGNALAFDPGCYSDIALKIGGNPAAEAIAVDVTDDTGSDGLPQVLALIGDGTNLYVARATDDLRDAAISKGISAGSAAFGSDGDETSGFVVQRNDAVGGNGSDDIVFGDAHDVFTLPASFTGDATPSSLQGYDDVNNADGGSFAELATFEIPGEPEQDLCVLSAGTAFRTQNADTPGNSLELVAAVPLPVAPLHVHGFRDGDALEVVGNNAGDGRFAIARASATAGPKVYSLDEGGAVDFADEVLGTGFTGSGAPSLAVLLSSSPGLELFLYAQFQDGSNNTGSAVTSGQAYPSGSAVGSAYDTLAAGRFSGNDDSLQLLVFARFDPSLPVLCYRFDSGSNDLESCTR